MHLFAACADISHNLQLPSRYPPDPPLIFKDLPDKKEMEIIEETTDEQIEFLTGLHEERHNLENEVMAQAHLTEVWDTKHRRRCDDCARARRVCLKPARMAEVTQTRCDVFTPVLFGKSVLYKLRKACLIKVALLRKKARLCENTGLRRCERRARRC